MSDFNEKYGYHPYIGGASGNQVYYDQLLQNALKAEGVKFTSYIDSDGYLNTVVKGREVAYDRWGYTANGNDDIDNTDLNAAMKYLLGE